MNDLSRPKVVANCNESRHSFWTDASIIVRE